MSNMNENPDENPDQNPDQNPDENASEPEELCNQDSGERPERWTDEWERALAGWLDDPGQFHSSRRVEELTFVQEFTYDIMDAYLDVNYMTRDEIAGAIGDHFERYLLRWPEEAAQFAPAV